MLVLVERAGRVSGEVLDPNKDRLASGVIVALEPVAEQLLHLVDGEGRIAPQELPERAGVGGCPGQIGHELVALDFPVLPKDGHHFSVARIGRLAGAWGHAVMPSSQSHGGETYGAGDCP